MSVNFPVDYNNLVGSYLTLNDIRRHAFVPAWVNETCAVQMSWALNHCGFAIGVYAYQSNEVYGGTVRAYQSPPQRPEDGGHTYIFAVPDMKVYLNNTYGDADNYSGSKDDMIGNISGRQGILSFGHRHIDLWDGSDFLQNGLISPGVWHDRSVRMRGIFFWEAGSSVLGF